MSQPQEAVLTATEARQETCRCCLGSDTEQPVLCWPELKGLWAHPGCLSDEAKLTVLVG